ncbi:MULTISPECIES: hypothetical protein [Streptomyces]|uniref:Streptomyces killer toxin-like beta/gamma crystallin domain-containing protein n=1 Tax=Streptomyces silvisoli TaxID=3034235 RepID=A0ABT5ZEB0_9ACTN|nr:MULTISPECIES: hypothetical protein [Streptomyces]MDF3288169.1 hypothetical protein [Streptomyces silvisoli]
MRTKFAVGLGTVALSAAMLSLTGGPAGAAVATPANASGPFRVHSYSGDVGATPAMWSGSSAQICFNIWGNHLRDGYFVILASDSGAQWTAHYYGPKNKTCSPWRHFRGSFRARILPHADASVDADVWLYYN